MLIWSDDKLTMRLLALRANDPKGFRTMLEGGLNELELEAVASTRAIAADSAQDLAAGVRCAASISTTWW